MKSAHFLTAPLTLSHGTPVVEKHLCRRYYQVFFSATEMQISYDMSLIALICFSFFFLFQTPATGKDKPQAGPSKSPSVAEIRNKLMAAAKEVRPPPSFTESLTPGLNPVIQHPPSLCTVHLYPTRANHYRRQSRSLRTLWRAPSKSPTRRWVFGSCVWFKSISSGQAQPLRSLAQMIRRRSFFVITDSLACAIVPHAVLIPHAAPFHAGRL